MTFGDRHQDAIRVAGAESESMTRTVLVYAAQQDGPVASGCRSGRQHSRRDPAGRWPARKADRVCTIHCRHPSPDGRTDAAAVAQSGFT